MVIGKTRAHQNVGPTIPVEISVVGDGMPEPGAMLARTVNPDRIAGRRQQQYHTPLLKVVRIFVAPSHHLVPRQAIDVPTHGHGIAHQGAEATGVALTQIATTDVRDGDGGRVGDWTGFAIAAQMLKGRVIAPVAVIYFDGPIPCTDAKPCTIFMAMPRGICARSTTAVDRAFNPLPMAIAATNPTIMRTFFFTAE